MVISLNGHVSILMLVCGVHQHKNKHRSLPPGSKGLENFLKGIRVFFSFGNTF